MEAAELQLVFFPNLSLKVGEGCTSSARLLFFQGALPTSAVKPARLGMTQLGTARSPGFSIPLVPAPQPRSSSPALPLSAFPPAGFLILMLPKSSRSGGKYI